METFLVKEGSWIENKTLSEIDLRGETGATVIAVVRGGRSFVNPGADFCFQAGDVLVLVGSHAQMDRACRLLGGEETMIGR